MGYNLWDVKRIQEKIKKKQETIERNSKKMKTAPTKVEVGWDESSGTYPEQGGKPVSYIAEIHEYGLGPHSEKSMLSSTEFLHSDEWAEKYKSLVMKSIDKDRIPNYDKIFRTIGNQIKKDLRDRVYEIDLVETHRLANSIIVRYKRR